MVNPMIFFPSCVGMIVVMHIHNLSWIVGPCLFHSLTLVLYQCKTPLLSLWLLCTYLSKLFSDVGHDILPNILPQNRRFTKVKLTGKNSCVHIPGFFSLRGGIHKVPGVGLGHNVRLELLGGVHRSH